MSFYANPFATASVMTSTRYELSAGPGYTVVFTGTGFTYDRAGLPSGGTASKVELVQTQARNTYVHQTMTAAAIDMGKLGDYFEAARAARATLPWSNVLSDYASGADGPTPDTLRFRNTDNTFTEIAGLDRDSIDSFADLQSAHVTAIRLIAQDGRTVMASVAPGPLTVDIVLAGVSTQFAAGLSALKISDGNSTITHTPTSLPWYSAVNHLYGGTGADRLVGVTNVQAAVPDALGFRGTHAGYDFATSAVRVDLAVGRASGGGGNDVLVAIDNVNGSTFNDTLIGNGNDNLLDGDNGDDSIEGGAGADRLFGDSGNDSLIGGAGNDTLSGSSGNDSLDGGDGNDTFTGDRGDDVYNGGAGIDTVDYNHPNESPGIAISLAAAGRQNASLDGFDTLSGIENLIGSVGADTLTGSSGGNDIKGGDGADRIFGGDGNDTLSGDGVRTFYRVSGNDYLDGGAGNDRLYGDAAPDPSTDPSTPASHDTLLGGDGNDTLEGGGGSDVLHGGSGDDRLIGDLFDLNAPPTPLTVPGNDTLEGGTGNDYLMGGNGNDSLVGGDGHDFLDGGFGNDVLRGGAGSDQVNLGVATAGVIVDLQILTAQNTGGAGTDQLVSIEHLLGSWFDDTLKGDSNNNSLQGNNGNDRLWGRMGNDTLSGGAGNDTMTGGLGQDTFRFEHASGNFGSIDTLVDFNAADDTILVARAGVFAIPAPLAATAFTLGTRATDADDRIVYDRATGSLYYDADGSGATAQVKFAVLQGTPMLAATDFMVV